MTHEPAEWLLICYREPEGSVRSIGIVLYVPGTDDLYPRFRVDYPFVNGEDREILSSTSALIIAVARDHGARSAFNWMSETLSNRIFVEGPHPVVTHDPEQTVSELFAANVRDLPHVNT